MLLLFLRRLLARAPGRVDVARLVPITRSDERRPGLFLPLRSDERKLLLTGSRLVRQNLRTRRHIQRRREVTVNHVGQLISGVGHRSLPLEVHLRALRRLVLAVAGRLGADVLEHHQAVQVERGLDLQDVGVHANRVGRQRFQLVRLPSVLCLPSQHEEFGEEVVHLIPIVRGLVKALEDLIRVQNLRRRVQEDVPHRCRGRDNGEHPEAPSQLLPLLAGQPPMVVAAHDEQGLEPIDIKRADVREVQSRGCADKAHGASPQEPRVQMRVGQDDGHPGGRVQGEAHEGLGRFGGQGDAVGFGRAPRAGGHRSHERERCQDVDQVLPKVGVAWSVGKCEDDAQLRAQRCGLGRGRLRGLLAQGLAERPVRVLAEPPDGEDGVRQGEGVGHDGQAHLACRDAALHEGHRRAQQQDADEQTGATDRMRVPERAVEHGRADDLGDRIAFDVVEPNRQAVGVLVEDPHGGGREAREDPDPKRGHGQRLGPADRPGQVLDVALMVTLEPHGPRVDSDE
mmetsp:Transcript_100636/g.307527  ORF Transcript_100636/g.307527 Transcript_100636/m.307527 type:complete len:512 (-) Transcript_100636:218-1753(-)